MKYAVHAYAWTSSWSNEDLWIIDHVAELGLDTVEIPLMELDAVDPAAIRERVRANELEVVTSVVVGHDTDPTSESESVRRNAVDFLRRCVNATAEMGATVFTGVIYSAIGGRIDRRPEEADYKRAAEVLREVAVNAGRLGVKIGIEPVNRYETFLINTVEQAERLRTMVDEPNVGLHLDAYHMNIEEEDFFNPVRLAAPNLIHFHLSESHRGIPGRGTVDWEGIMAALRESGYSGHVGLESFVGVSGAMREATCVWRDLAPSSDELVSKGLEYLKGLEGSRTTA